VPNHQCLDELFSKHPKASPAIVTGHARADLETFLEIPAGNIDIGNHECTQTIHGDVRNMTPLDFQVLIVRKLRPSHYLLQEGICRLKKQLAIGKRSLLAVDESEEDVVKFIRSRPLSVHVLVKALQVKSLMEDSGFHEGIICCMLGIDFPKVNEYLLLATIPWIKQSRLLHYPSSLIKHIFLKPLAAERRRLLEQLYKR
jgi:hypothetical protein